MKINKTKKYIIATDLDGTFLNNEHKFEKKKANAVIKKLHDLGHVFLPVTGRREDEVNKKLLKGLNHKHGGIYYSGAVLAVKDEKNNKPKKWKNKTIDTKVFTELLTDKTIIGKTTRVYFNSAVEFKDSDKLDFEKIMKDYKELFEAFFMFDNEKHDVKKIVKQIEKKYSNHLEIRHFIKVRPGYCAIQFGPKNSSKAEALKAACDFFKVKQENVIFFGDNANDLEALEWAGHGVAMKNASDLAKKKANTTMKWTNDENGVINYISELFNLQ